MSALLAILAGLAVQPVQGVVDLALGMGNAGPSACALDRQGGVWCWGGESTVASPRGWGGASRPGDGSIPRHGARPRPAMRGIRRFARSSVAHDRMCGIVDRRRVRCFWANRKVDIPVANATEVALGEGFGCALIADGTVRCWGSNVNCALGEKHAGKCEGSELRPVQVQGVSGAIAISLAQYGGCALDRGGGLTCWGVHPFFDGNFDVRRIGGVPALAMVSLASDEMLAVTREGRLLFSRFEVGKPAHLAPVPGTEHLGPIAQVVAGYELDAIVLADGHVLLYGPGYDTVLAGVWPPKIDKGKAYTDPPRQVPGIDDATFAAVSALHACFVTRAGRVRCIGTNMYGDLADGTLDPNTEGPPSTAGRFEADALPVPTGGVGGCTATPDERHACLKAGDACTLVPPPEYWGGPWCSGATPPPNWHERQLAAQRGKPVPSCECTCSARYQREERAAEQHRARCSMLP